MSGYVDVLSGVVETELMMRVLITGDRHWNCTELASRIVARLVERYSTRLVVVHGCATGVDSAFAVACNLQGVTVEPHPANWNKYGLAAGPIRNMEMINAGVDLALAVHRDLVASKGTKDCVNQCLTAGIPVWLVKDFDNYVRLESPVV